MHIDSSSIVLYLFPHNSTMLTKLDKVLSGAAPPASRGRRVIITHEEDENTLRDRSFTITTWIKRLPPPPNPKVVY